MLGFSCVLISAADVRGKYEGNKDAALRNERIRYVSYKSSLFVARED